MPHATILPSPETLAAFCRRWRVRRLGLFGSVVRDDFTPESDVDVLVEFDPGCVPGLAFFRMEQELTEVLARRADLHTPECLSPYFRDEVLRETDWIYVQTQS